MNISPVRLNEQEQLISDMKQMIARQISGVCCKIEALEMRKKRLKGLKIFIPELIQNADLSLSGNTWKEYIDEK